MKHFLLALLLGGFLVSCGGEEGGSTEESGTTTPKTESQPDKPEVITDSQIKSFEKDGKFGLRAGYGDDDPLIMEAKYDYIGLLEPGQLIVVGNGTRKDPDDTFLKEGKYGYVNFKGEEVVPLKYDEAENMHHGVGAVGMNDGKYVKWGAVDRTGVERMEVKYSSINVSPQESPSTFSIDFLWGVVDSNFNILVEPTYNAMDRYYDEGLLWVGKGRGQVMNRLSHGKYGYLDTKGELVIPIEFEMASEFSEGLAAVSKKDKYGYINKEGELVIDYQFDNARDFRDGKAKVDVGDESFEIDKEGNKL